MSKNTASAQAILFDSLDPDRIRVESARKLALETGRTRLLVTGVVLCLAFAALAVRLAELTAFGIPPGVRLASLSPHNKPITARADIRDRNGMLIATSLPTRSLFADPRDVMDIEEAALKLGALLPNVSAEDVRHKLALGGRFQWIARNLTPTQVYAVNRLGLPGFSFRDGERRVYPFGPIFAHVLGYTDVDGRGIAGVERAFDKKLSEPVAPGETRGIDLALDLRFQTILREELAAAQQRFSAVGAAGVVIDAKTGEVLAMASLPDFNPNEPEQALGKNGFNRATKGVYEMGSTFKLFSTATALDSGAVSIADGYDTSEPLKAARFTINDFHGKKRWLSVPEILVYSSNIGTAKMALEVGAKKQKEYMRRFGMLSPAAIEIPEVGHPLYPERWGEISTMTISYGHGIAVSPLHVASGVATLVNGGVMHPPSILKRDANSLIVEERVLSPKTSATMRALMRLVVRFGTGRNADVKGYRVGGKTGTAEKQVGGGYSEDALVSSFVGAFPMNDPRYVVLVVIDEPKGIKSSFGFATGGWVAAPAVKSIVGRIAALTGMLPQDVSDEEPIKPGTPFYIPARATQPAPKIALGGIARAAH